MRACVLVALLSLALNAPSRALAIDETRPNILWIIVDDMSPNLGCYGETTIKTPATDRLASQGLRFSNAFVTAPVCSPCRSSLITGCYQTTIGAQNHRSGRGKLKITLENGVTPIPLLFQHAGYFTCITSWPIRNLPGKTDYNFEWSPSIYHGIDWSSRKPNQPFFAQVQLQGGKLRDGKGLSPRIKQELGSPTNPADVKLPPYYPDDPVIRQDWADYLDAVRYTDLQVQQILDRLRREKLEDSTIVFFMTDHGISHARGKQFLYDEGIHVPLIIRGRGIPSRKIRSDLVEHIDLAATSLALAQIEKPTWMQGQDLLNASNPPRSAVFGARDRCDETVDHIRSVRTQKYKYIRNYLPDRPHLQPNHYKDHKPTYQRIRALHAEGNLTGLPLKLLMAPARTGEELYDLSVDPFETSNLASNPGHSSTLIEMRNRLRDWETRTGDRGRTPESPEMYESDMQAYLENMKGLPRQESEELRSNIKLMKQWAKEGK